MKTANALMIARDMANAKNAKHTIIQETKKHIVENKK